MRKALLVNIANVCTCAVTCNDPTYVEPPPEVRMSKEFVGLSDVCDRRERPLTHRLLLHLPDALTHLNSHKQMAQCVADAENTKTLEKVFDKSQLCKVAKVKISCCG